MYNFALGGREARRQPYQPEAGLAPVLQEDQLGALAETLRSKFRQKVTFCRNLLLSVSRLTSRPCSFLGIFHFVHAARSSCQKPPNASSRESTPVTSQAFLYKTSCRKQVDAKPYVLLQWMYTTAATHKAWHGHTCNEGTHAGTLHRVQRKCRVTSSWSIQLKCKLYDQEA